MALPFPNVRPEIVTLPALHVWRWTIGPFSVRWYALGYIAGILLGWRYAVGLVRNVRLWGAPGPVATPAQIDDLIVWLTLGIIGGGRLGYVLFYMLPLKTGRETLGADPMEVFRLWHGGMSFHGGMVGVAVAIVLFARSNSINFIRLADLVAPCAPIGIGLVRIANFINGELWGRVTKAPWGMVFCGPHIATYTDGQCIAGPLPRHPSQIYESILEGLFLFLVLRWATHKAGWLERRGALTGLFLLVYGLCRIALENVRMPDEGLRNLPFGLTVGILLSAPMVLVGAWLVGRHYPAVPAAKSNDAR